MNITQFQEKVIDIVNHMDADNFEASTEKLKKVYRKIDAESRMDQHFKTRKMIISKIRSARLPEITKALVIGIIKDVYYTSNKKAKKLYMDSL